MLRKATCAILLLFLAIAVSKYRIVVSSDGTDLYRIEYEAPVFYVVTENCMEYAQYDDAILDVNRRTLYFVKRGVECHVRAVR